MTRKRELYMDVTLAGRNFVFEEEVLEVVGEEAEIITAYFAEKILEYKEKTHEETFSFTFGDDDNVLDSQAKKTKLANYIRGKLTFDGDKKYTNNQKILDALTESSYKKDDEITIVALKKEKKEYYKKISGSPMDYQVYLIAETKNLDGKKVKIKILENKSADPQGDKKLKILKTEESVLPVLVFANKEDKTTDTEVADWIAIDIKEEDGKILNKTEGETIEVGIKKIQLRPKKDKMASKSEEAAKSFEGWQEALYIREEETEAGKKALEDEKVAKTTRDAETFTTLTRDTDADKKENRKSYPKSITGPKSVAIEKEAIYTIDTYSKSATEEDKKNIRWSLYKQGDPKTTYTVIDAKSKTGLYTYAKMELDGTKNKLTIIFDKALAGKKIQIEPYRNTPDIDNKHDYVRTTTVNKKAPSKITERDVAQLWLKATCDSIESSGEVLKYEFYKGSGFKLETPNTIHIYEDGKISKLNLEGLDKVKYLYYDSNGDSHHISTNDLIKTKKKSIGKSVSSFRSEAAIKSIDYEAKNITGVDAKTSRIYANGDVITDGKKYGKSHYKIEYKSLTDEVVLVHMKKIDRVQKPIIKFHFHETLREYSNPYYFGAFIGALADIEFDVSCGGSCYEDGTAFPSLEHSNGYAIDTGYKYKKASDNKIIEAMKKFGFTKRIRGSTTYLDTLTGHSQRDKGSLHDSHLHCGKLIINQK